MFVVDSTRLEARGLGGSFSSEGRLLKFTGETNKVHAHSRKTNGPPAIGVWEGVEEGKPSL